MLVTDALAQSSDPASAAQQAGAATQQIATQMASRFTSLVDSVDKILVFAFAIFTILLFVRDRFDRPTYTLETHGFLALFSPRFLATDVRYRQGASIYATCMLALFIFLVFSGQRLVAAFFPGFNPAGANPEMFPLVIALLIVGISSSPEPGLLGSIEERIRRFAHQRAFIPTGTKRLASRIALEHFGTWQLPHNPAIIARMFDALRIELPPANLAVSSDIKSVLDDLKTALDTINHTPRAGDFISVEELSRKSQEMMEEFRTKYENVSAFRLLYSVMRTRMALEFAFAKQIIPPDIITEMKGAISDVEGRYSKCYTDLCTVARRHSDEILRSGTTVTSGGSTNPELLETITASLQAMIPVRNDMAVLLAGSIMHGRPSDTQIALVLDQIGLESDGVPIRRSWTPAWMIFTVSIIGAALVLYLSINLFGHAVLKQLLATSDEQFQALVSNLPFTLINAVFLYSAVVLICYLVRDELMDRGDWRERPYSRLKAAWLVSVVVAPACLFFSFLVVPQQISLFGLLAPLSTAAPLAFAAAVAFFYYFSVIGRTPLKFDGYGWVQPRNSVMTAVRALPTAVLHAAVVTAIIVPATYFIILSQQVPQTLAQVAEQFMRVANAGKPTMTSQGGPVSPPSTGTQSAGPSSASGVASNGGMQANRGNENTTTLERPPNTGSAATESNADQFLMINQILTPDIRTKAMAWAGYFARQRMLSGSPMDETKAPSEIRNLDEIICGPSNAEFCDTGDGPAVLLPHAIQTLGNFGVDVYGTNRSLEYARKFEPIDPREKSAFLYASFSWLDTTASREVAAISLVVGFCAYVFAFSFSLLVPMLRANEIDEYFEAFSAAGSTRLKRRLADANWLRRDMEFDGEEDRRAPRETPAPTLSPGEAAGNAGPSPDPAKGRQRRRDGKVRVTRPEFERFAQALARPRHELFGVSVQEALMSDGSYNVLVDRMAALRVQSRRTGRRQPVTGDNAMQHGESIQTP